MGRYRLIQTPQYIETVLLGCYHENNEYTVVNEQGQKMYRIVEDASICFRCACLCNCPPSNRPYMAKIYNFQDTVVAELDRPCQCSYLCICRPTVFVKDPTGTEIGRVVNPCPAFLCCNMTTDVYTQTGFKEYSTSICICNFHVCCECCVGPCAETEVSISLGDHSDPNTAPIFLKKTWAGFAKECYSAANEYEFEVPDTWNEGQWAKFLANIQLFDMLFFEQYWQCFIGTNCKIQHYTC